MAGFETPSAPETQEIPEFKLDLQDVPESSPQAFNRALYNNVLKTVMQLTDYLSRNREKVLDASPVLQYFGRKYREKAEGQITEFIANLAFFSTVILNILNSNQDKSIAEQRALLLDPCIAFTMELGSNYGVMQSYIPYKFGDTLNVTDRGILNPVIGHKEEKQAYKPLVRREYHDPEQVAADKILDELS